MAISNRLLSLVLLFSALSVWGHWNLLSDGVFVLGVNASLFWLGIAFILYSSNSHYGLKRDWTWVCPIALIVLSFSLYENPWLKLISLSVLPIVVGFFCAYSHVYERQKVLWNCQFVYVLCKRFFKPVGALRGVIAGMFQSQVFSPNVLRHSLFNRVCTGLLILIPLVAIVIPLLASADTVFREAFFRGIENLYSVLTWSSALKLCVTIVLTVLLLAMHFGWNGAINPVLDVEYKQIDGLVAGIVLGGLLAIYLFFLFLQVDHFVLTRLPENFRKAELLVKSGFWQLFVLAVLNTGLFFMVYKRTGWGAQMVLRIFIIASSLLMVSAAWKVWLYSYTFGLSYEKFFAMYTALFGLCILIYLVVASFSATRFNVIRVIAFTSLWGYAVATVSPIEKFIFNTNVHLSKQSDTRITLSQLTQLSLDILTSVDAHGISELAKTPDDAEIWKHWRLMQVNERCNKAWYETNFVALTSCR